MRKLRWLLLLGMVPVAAQNTDPPFLQKLRDIVKDIDAIKGNPSFIAGDRLTQVAEQISFANRNRRFFLQYCYANSLPRFVNLEAVEQGRMDKQIGAPASSSGSTSLVSKAGSPGFFGMALENGGFTKSVNGTTVTLSGNLIGMTDMMAARGYLSGYDDDSKPVRFLRRVSASVSLDLSRQPAASADASTGLVPSPAAVIRNQIDQFRQELAGYSVRVDVLNRRDPRDSRNFEGMTALMDNRLQDLLQDADDALGALQDSDEYLVWRAKTASELVSGSARGVELEVPFFRGMDQLCALAEKVVPDFDSKLQKALASYQRVFEERAGILKSLEKKPLLAAEYMATKEYRQPDLGTARLIYERQFRQTRMDLTVNGSMSWFNNRAANGAEGVRDWQVASEASLPLGKRCGCGGAVVGNPVLSFAALVEKVKVRAPVTFGTVTINAEPGVIAVGQVKLVIPIKNSGVKVPLSISFANRTELIAEKEIRANIGFTFDYDSVAAIFKK